MKEIVFTIYDNIQYQNERIETIGNHKNILEKIERQNN